MASEPLAGLDGGATDGPARPGSYRLGRIGGIDLFVHWTWIIIAVLLVLGYWGQITSANPDLSRPAAIALALTGTIGLFASVLVHELAHSLVARRRGFEVKGITLYLFGGATETDASSKRPGDELVVAVVGPVTSIVFAVVLWGISLAVTPASEPLGDLVGYLAVVNIILAVFNMTPGLPLDGGRVLRAIAWAMTGDFARATRVAATAGVVVGYSLMGLGFLMVWSGQIGGLWFAAIGWVISQGARGTEQHEELRQVFKALVAADVMSSPVTTIPGHTSIDNAVRRFFARENRSAFPVADRDGEIVGMLTLRAVEDVEPGRRATTTAAEAARPVGPTFVVSPSTPMLEVIDTLSTPVPKGRILVVDDGRLVGIISPSDILRRQTLAPLLGPPRE
jgi:Zn-dependent protease/predicted transcriptional regulator